MSGIYNQLKQETVKNWEVMSMNAAFSYAFNFEHDFIEKSGITPVEHMKRKFENIYSDHKNPTYAFMKFWAECDAENQNKLMDYIKNR